MNFLASTTKDYIKSNTEEHRQMLEHNTSDLNTLPYETGVSENKEKQLHHLEQNHGK